MNDDETNGDKGVSRLNAMGISITMMRDVHILGIQM